MRVEVGGVRLAVVDEGVKRGTPIVLLHGLASTHRWWDLVAKRLVSRYRVIRFDHRGHGESDAPAGGYHIGQLATDTRGVLDALDLDGAVLVGHSLGAAVALRVAAEHPDRVTALGCVDGGVYDPRRLFGAAWEQARAVMTRPRRGRVTGAVLRAWLASTDLPAAALPAIAANYTENGPDGGLRLRLAADYEADLAHDQWRQDPLPLLRAVRVPVLVTAARQGDPGQDVPRRESIERAAAVLGDRLTVRWLDAGHDLPLHRPDETAAQLSDLATVKISASWR